MSAAMRVYLLLLLLPLSTSLILSKDECREVGFNPDSLKCRSCDSLINFNLELLLTDCNACCQEEKELKHEKYPMANIEVCECNLARFPQVQAFVRSHMDEAWNGKVRVKHVRGIRPQIVLKDATGSTKQTLSIEKWDTDTITDFLNQWIE